MTDDLISRQAVLELPRNITRNFFGEIVEESIDIKRIEALPSAQDVVEVVRCKDCKWYAGEGMYCANDFIPQFDHFYCYNGERRDDDEKGFTKSD